MRQPGQCGFFSQADRSSKSFYETGWVARLPDKRSPMTFVRIARAVRQFGCMCVIAHFAQQESFPRLSQR